MQQGKAVRGGRWSKRASEGGGVKQVEQRSKGRRWGADPPGCRNSGK